jgi:hypothetical protein
MLFIRCSENVTSLFVDVSPFSVSGKVTVLWRIDGEKSVSGAWWAAASNGGVGPWNGGQAIRFIKSLVDRKTLQFRFTRQEGHPIEAAFNGAPGIDRSASLSMWMVTSHSTLAARRGARRFFAARGVPTTTTCFC